MGCSSASELRAGTGVATRLRQGVAALFCRRGPVPPPARFRRHLPGAVVAQWRALASYDQRHLIAVAATLAASNHPEPVVLAGLLHDIGKAGRITVVDRVAHVLLGRLAPDLRDRLARRHRPLPGLNGLHLLLRHAAAGADALERAGMPAEVVWLVRHHERDLPHSGLTALRAADRRH